ncbi:uncharacterized protein LOC144432948 [Glandiceps talaboti]
MMTSLWLVILSFSVSFLVHGSYSGNSIVDEPPRVAELVKKLQLVPHIEGGYFRETYRSGATPMASGGLTDPSGTLIRTENDPSDERNILTSIYYLLTRKQPKNYWHRNKSDLIRYFHGGDSLNVYMIDPQGTLSIVSLGLNTLNGDVPQMVVPSGYWEASELKRGRHGWVLEGEAVAPGFDYRDMEIGTEELVKEFPHLKRIIRRLLKKDR